MLLYSERGNGRGLALGALASNVRLLILKEVGSMVLIGVAVGLPLAYGLARFSESLLYGVHAGDPVVYALGLGLIAQSWWTTSPLAQGAAAPGRWRLHYPRCPRIANRGKTILPRLPGGWPSDREVGWGPRAAANEERAPPCPPRSRGGKILRNEYEQSDIASSFRGARQREPEIQPFSARVLDSGFRLRRRRNDGDRSRSPPCGAWNDG